MVPFVMDRQIQLVFEPLRSSVESHCENLPPGILPTDPDTLHALGNGNRCDHSCILWSSYRPNPNGWGFFSSKEFRLRFAKAGKVDGYPFPSNRKRGESLPDKDRKRGSQNNLWILNAGRRIPRSKTWLCRLIVEKCKRSTRKTKPIFYSKPKSATVAVGIFAQAMEADFP